MSRFGKPFRCSSARTLPAPAPGRFQRREAGLVSYRTNPPARPVVIDPAGAHTRDVVVAREAVGDLELRHVEAVVDRLREIRDRVRVEAVEGPPAGVVVGQ